MRCKTILAVLVAVAGAVRLGELPAAAPKPKVVSDAWQLEFGYHQLQAIRLNLPGYDEPQTFWYLLYTVTNRTGEDRYFVPDIMLYTESGELLRAGRGASRSVYNAIKKLHNEPLLRTPSAMIGKLLQGEDNAKRGVAVWPDFDPNSSTIDIFIGGLSGENIEIKLPRPIKKTLKTAKGEEKVITLEKIVLSKTLQMRFKVTGDPGSRRLNPAMLLETKWVMR